MSGTVRPAYRIRFRSRRVLRELDALSHTDYRRVVVAIESLAAEPRSRGAVHLEDDIYRIRVGRYRIIYLIDDGDRTVSIGGVRRRTERTYRRIRDMFSG
jgi:mRNA interferase RelE/StbE